MKKIILVLILLLCLTALSCESVKSPLPRGIRMGMSREEIAGITGGEIYGGWVITEDGIYYFGQSGLIGAALHKNS